MTPLPTSIATLDFEASDMFGYPIEVGVAIHVRGHTTIEVWSSLIKPTAQWLQTKPWSASAAALHGIAYGDLLNAPTATDVADQLNARLAHCGVAYSDAWGFDQRWLFLLMQETQRSCAFTLCDASALAERLGIVASSLFEAPNGIAPAHRAGADAERLLRQALRSAEISNQTKHKPAAPASTEDLFKKNF